LEPAVQEMARNALLSITDAIVGDEGADAFGGVFVTADFVLVDRVAAGPLPAAFTAATETA
jgi:hypothetical protein